MVPTSRRVRWLGGLLLVFVTFFAWLNWATRRRDYRTVAGAEATLDSAGLTVGVSSARVLAVLDSLRAQHSSLGTDRTVRARLGPSFQDFIIRGDLFAEFRFDSAGRLTWRAVREGLTGP